MIRNVLAWTLQPIVALIAIALLLAAVLAAVPVLWTWYASQLPRGVPAAGAALFGLAIVVAVLTTRRDG